MAKHEFALFYQRASTLKISNGVVINDHAIVRRVAHVLRLQPDAQFVLFDNTSHFSCRLIDAKKQAITIDVLRRHKNQVLRPEIIWFLPILEREAFDQAVSALTVMGVSRIVPIVTEKSRTKWGTEKDHARLQRVMIAAAEQSKQFIIPHVDKVQTFRASDFQQYAQYPCIYFDPQGESAFSCLSSLRTQMPKKIYGMVGPEGDLSSTEKTALKQAQFTFCALTPTVLRAVDAIRIGAGMLRSLL